MASIIDAILGTAGRGQLVTLAAGHDRVMLSSKVLLAAKP